MKRRGYISVTPQASVAAPPPASVPGGSWNHRLISVIIVGGSEHSDSKVTNISQLTAH